MTFDIAGFLAAAWRRRRVALTVAATVWVSGWSVVAVMQASDGRSPHERSRASADGAVPRPVLDDARARLRADLEAARRQRLEALGALAATPATLGEGDAARSNPLHQRLLALEERRRRSIATLERRLAALRPRRSAAATTETRPAGPERGEASRPIHAAALFGAVPLAALIIGVASAGWYGGRDGVFDGIAGLEAATGLPVLGAIGRVRHGPRS